MQLVCTSVPKLSSRQLERACLGPGTVVSRLLPVDDATIDDVTIADLNSAVRRAPKAQADFSPQDTGVPDLG